MLSKSIKFTLTFLLLILSLTLTSAVLVDNPYLPIVKPDPLSFPINATINVSVNSSVYWDTQDRGPLDQVSDIWHNWLSNIQGGSSGEYYHLNSSAYNEVAANVFSWITLSEVNSILANIHDQDLNTTDNVTFNEVNISCNGLQGANQSCLNVSGDAYFRDVHARDVYVSNNTLYIGDSITLSAGGGALGSVLNVSGGNVTVGDAGFYFGSGKYLTDINTSNLNFTGSGIEANYFSANSFNGGNFTGNNFTGENAYFDTYNWIAETPWLVFNGSYLYFNETKLKADAEVTLQTEVTVIPIAGGTGSATTANVIDFEIKEFDVSCTAGMNFRFEADETTSGAIIDKNRKQHTTDWRIEKNYPINDTVDLTISSTNPATGSCTVQIKYLDNFE